MDHLIEILKQRKSIILEKWFQVIVDTYPSDAANFLKLKKDKFQNPVGQTILEEIENLFDELIEQMDKEKINVSIENIMRIRAVQDFSPSEAVSFLFQLKKTIVSEINVQIPTENIISEFLEIESRIDQLALIAFEYYSKSREKIYEIRIKEIKKWSTGLFAKINPSEDKTLVVDDGKK